MSERISRRSYNALTAGLMIGSITDFVLGDDAVPATPPKPVTPASPVEAPFERDYPAPDFKPSWKKPQLNRLLVQDFVIYAHSDLEMTKKLLEQEPA